MKVASIFSPGSASLLLLAALMATPLAAAPPVVSNVSPAQRAGTKLVDVTY